MALLLKFFLLLVAGMGACCSHGRQDLPRQI
jgi:hypothetical protein